MLRAVLPQSWLLQEYGIALDQRGCSSAAVLVLFLQLLTPASLHVCCSLSSWLWWHHWAGQPWDGLCQLHGAPAADAAAADVQPRDAFSDHGEPLGAEHDV